MGRRYIFLKIYSSIRREDADDIIMGNMDAREQQLLPVQCLSGAVEVSMYTPRS